MESQCDNSNPHFDSGGYFGYTEKFGNHPGGQAEYLKVPFGNFTPFVIPESCELEDESLLFLSDVLPTAYWSVKMQVLSEAILLSYLVVALLD